MSSIVKLTRVSSFNSSLIPEYNLCKWLIFETSCWGLMMFCLGWGWEWGCVCTHLICERSVEKWKEDSDRFIHAKLAKKRSLDIQILPFSCYFGVINYLISYLVWKAFVYGFTCLHYVWVWSILLQYCILKSWSMFELFKIVTL